MTTFLSLITILYYIFFWTLIIRVIMSWFNVRPDNPLVVLVYSITEPILSPLRRVTPRIGVIDITPMLAMILLYLILRMLYSAFG